MWRGTVHQCLYTDKSMLQELVPMWFNPHCVGRGCLGECEEAQGDQGTKQPTLLVQTHMTDAWQWWGRGGILEKWWSPWPETSCLLSWAGAQNEVPEQQLGRRMQLSTNSLCALPHSSFDLNNHWDGLVWLGEGDTGNYLVHGSKSDSCLDEMDSYQPCCPEISVERELGILARFLLELNSNCKLIHHLQLFNPYYPLCYLESKFSVFRSSVLILTETFFLKSNSPI